jgi:hypothetical protein
VPGTRDLLELSFTAGVVRRQFEPTPFGAPADEREPAGVV